MPRGHISKNKAPEGEDALAPLVFSYREILDATKHQEDKISRLLTAVAFLTAAALGLANLAGPKAIAQDFAIGAANVPICIIPLGTFLISIVATVVILLSSTTTPLRFPGSPRARDLDGPPGVDWADKAVPASQIYFHEIAGTSLKEWHQKWQSSESRLRNERRDSLIRETHNLAVRTEFKYERMNEAVVIFSFGLASLAISVVLVMSSLRAESGPIELTVLGKLTLAAVVFGYSWLQLFVSSRDSLHAVEDLESATLRTGSRPKKALAATRIAFPIVAAAAPASLVLGWNGSPIVAVLVFAPVPILAWAMFFMISIGDKFKRGSGLLNGGLLPAARETAERVAKRTQFWTGGIAVAYAVTPAVSTWVGGYGLMLAASYAAPAILLIAGLTNTLVHRRRRLQRYLDRHIPAPQ